MECPVKRVKIPSVYVEDSRNGVPVVVMLTIGYSGHGKTCFLSSFFHTLYHGRISEKWPGFSFIGLTMETLNRIHNEYVNILDHGRLPPKTPIMFPTPLILKFQKMPLKVRSFYKRYVKRIKKEPQEIILIFYDIGGGTFDVDEKIRQNIPILQEINTLIFLISLPRIINDRDGSPANIIKDKDDLLRLQAHTGISVVQQMHKLLNTIVLAIGAVGLKKKKNILICFTMGDEMWEDCEDNRYGQLAIPINHPMPYPEELPEYFATFGWDSEIIKQHIQEEYTPFYNALINNFRSIHFTSISSLGSHPTEDGKIMHLSPTNIFDPVLSLLNLEGLL
jgi:hypothetical protein